MMKMENIAFFLTACKSRFNIPQPVIFAPTDIHDDNDPAAMRKVVNVLLLMKNDSMGDESMEEAAEKLRQFEEEREKQIAIELEAEGIVPEPKKPTTFVIPDEIPNAGTEDVEPDTEPEPEPEPEPEIETEPEPPKPVAKVPATKSAVPAQPKTATAKTSAATVTNGSTGLDTDWYLHGRTSDYVDVQGEILAEIRTVIHSELSFESKLKLVHTLQGQVEATQNKFMRASNEELRQIAHSMGLGNSVNDVPAAKPRQWYIDFILKYGRAQ